LDAKPRVEIKPPKGIITQIIITDNKRDPDPRGE
jgi:hypothetical protein